MTIWIIIAAVAGVIVGALIMTAAQAKTIKEARMFGTNLAMSIVGMTAELTYGEEWVNDFVAECHVVMDTYPEEIILRAKKMMLVQQMKLDIDKLGKK